MTPYLQVENLSKRIGDLTLFENISFTVAQGQKVALIAKNGTGKSTLLNIIGGYDSETEGKITFTNDISIGYLQQNPVLPPRYTVMQTLFDSDSPVVNAIKAYESALNTGDQQQLDEAMLQMDQQNAWDYEVRIKQVLTQLKIYDLDKKIAELSGGQQKRVAMAAVLINEPDLLILDGPTNHLDLEMIEWFEKYLSKSKSTLLMVTHDRYFLDRVCNEIVEMDDNRIFAYKGNYSYFLEKREERIQQSQAEVDKARNILRTELEWLRRMPKARGHKAKYRVENAHRLKEKAAQRKEDKEVAIHVKATRLGKKIIEIEGLSKSFDDINVINNFSYTFSRFEKIGIIGKNGTGKSTFLNLITGQLQADEGKIDVGETIRFGYYRQKGISFNPKERVIDIAREIAEVVNMGNGQTLSVSQFLSHFLFPHDTQYNYIEKLSGGEQRRLYLCTVLMRNPNFLILDEPTNDLDIMTLNVLEDYLASFQGCVLIVSHDRYFMDKIVDHLFVFEEGAHIKDFPGNYTIYRNHTIEKGKKEPKAPPKEKVKREKRPAEKRKLSYNEKRELEQLENDIARLEEEKQTIETALNSGELSIDELTDYSKRFSEIKNLLDEKELRWLELSEFE